MNYIDMFGVPFYFTTNKKLYFSSNLGGLVTILFSICVVVISVLFGRDFIYKKNPRIYQQTVYPNNYPNPITLDSENFVFPWRVMNYIGKNLNMSGKIYPKLIHKRRVTNSTGSYIVSYNKLEPTKCNFNNSKMIEFNEKYDISNYNCFDWTNNNYTFGGYLDGSYTDNFQIEFSLCPNNIYFTKDGNCTSLDDFFKILLSSELLYFELLYPEVYFIPEDIENPLRINFKTHFFNFSPNIARLDRVFISKTLLYDDLGWILENKREVFKYSVKEIKSDLTFYDKKYLGEEYTQATFYACNFYMTKNYSVFNRSFMKLQELSASIGGFIKAVLFFVQILMKYYNNKTRNNYIYNEIFNFRETENEKSNINSNIPKFINCSRQILTIQNQSSLKILEEKTNSKLEDYVYRKSKNISKNYDLSLIDYKKNKIDFGFCYIIKKFLKVKNVDNILKLYELIQRYFSDKLDLLYYLKHLQNFDNFKRLILNEEQSLAIVYAKNPIITYNKDEINFYSEDFNNENLNKLIKYFKEKIVTKSLSDTDKKILELIYPEIYQVCKDE